MNILDGFRRRIALAMASDGSDDGKGSGGKSPWGKKGGKKDGEKGGKKGSSGGSGGGPRNPWLPGGGGSGGGSNGSGDDGGPRKSASIEDIFKNRGPEGPRRGGPNFRLPERPDGKSWLPLVLLAIVGAWIFMSAVHIVGAKEEGVVTTFGKYNRTLGSGFNMTAPWPFQAVNVMPVSTIRRDPIPDGAEEKLILTGDQNLVNLSYVIRWNIKDLKDFQFQLASPRETIREVAEQAMRAEVAEKTLDETFSGSGRAEIEAGARSRMQGLLDAYRSGVMIQGVEIEKAEPPAEVNEAFKDVSVAEQDANASINTARGTAQQILERAQGETGAFDRVYEEYRRAPEVTRRRLYYETMERVLSGTDKTIIETDGVTPYLPLPEIRRRSQQNQPTPAQPNSAGGQ